MKRRNFLGALGSTVAWPLVAQAQQPGRVRRIAVLMPFSESSPEIQARFAAFKQRLKDFGWTDGRNVRIDHRFTDEDPESIRIGAGELVAAAPDVIVVYANSALAALRQATRVIPIVFVQVSDPVTSGFVASLARPAGNITGFQNFEAAIGGKWLEILKQIAPKVRRAAVLINPNVAANVAFLHSAEAAANLLGVTVTAAGVRDAADIERVLTAFAKEPDGGLIVGSNPTNLSNRELIIALAARLGLPAIYPYRHYATSGGLVSYGFDQLEQSLGAASYVDRILKGEKPGDLPVQAPTRYQWVINLKTAKALDLTVLPTVLSQADEVIE